MAINVPMPALPGEALLKGVGVGSNMFTQMMHPVLQRENMARQWREHQDKQKQLEAHFQANFGLSKAAAGRAAQAATDAHQMAMNKLDPTFEAKQYEALENYFRNKSNANAGNTAPQEAMPAQEMGEGMGVFTPEGMQQAQQPQAQQSMPGNLSGPDLELMRANPMLRGWYKQHYKIDPLAEESAVLHGPARDASDLEKLKKQKGENSEVFQNAQAAYLAQIDAKKDLRDLRARTKAGLKPGEKEFFDEKSGTPLGKEIPLTAKERESEEGNILFNELYPHVYKGASPFSGEGSINRLYQAASNYKTDPKARKLFDDFLLSEKMLAATTVNEASTLKAGRTNRTYNMLKESLESQDVPNVIKTLIKQFGIPPQAQLHASMRYQKLLSDARKKARKGTPATQKLFYNPEMQAQHEQSMESDKSKSVIVIDPNGKRFETTKENAAHLPKGWTRD